MQRAESGSGVGESDAPVAARASHSLGPAGAVVLGVAAIASVLANQLSAVTSISRITSSCADQGLLPRWFGKISPRFATPINSILAVGGISLGLALSGSFITLAVISTVARLFAYFASIAAIPRLDQLAGRLRWGRGVLLPLLACGLILWAASHSSWTEWRAFVGFLVVGALLYFIAGRGRRAES